MFGVTLRNNCYSTCSCFCLHVRPTHRAIRKADVLSNRRSQLQLYSPHDERISQM